MVSLDKISLKEWQEKGLEHLRYEYDLKPGEECLDIGSYRREWADEMIRRYQVQVECFDALDNRAAWTFNGHLKFGGAYYYTSMYEKDASIQYACIDIAEFIDSEIAVCKINIEGGEYWLIDYMIEKGLMKFIKNIQVQFHLIEGQDTQSIYATLAERLSQTHKLTWRYPFVWENWERC